MLQLVQVSRAHHAIIGIEDSQALIGGLSQPVMSHPMVLHCHSQLGSDEIIHHHVE